MNTSWQEQYMLETAMRSNSGRHMNILMTRSTSADLFFNFLETEGIYYLFAAGPSFCWSGLTFQKFLIYWMISIKFDRRIKASRVITFIQTLRNPE